MSLLFLLTSATNSFAQTVGVNFSTVYQTIRGYGGMNYTTWIGDLSDDIREKAFGNNPGEIGLSILRIHLDPDSNTFKLEVPTATFAIQKGASVFATPWNAPSRVLDGTTANRVDPAKYGEYVNHLNQFNNFMTKNGAPLYAISVQNEPDYGDWTHWTATEMLNFMKGYADKINHPRVIAPESYQFVRANFTDPLLNDAQAAANFEIVGGHIYGGGLLDYPLARTKGKDVWMTEHLLGSGDGTVNNWDLALTFGKEVNDCMAANFNAYVYWYIRRFYGLISDDGNITDKGYVLSQYSKFIRPGAVRVAATVTSAPNIAVTAYKTDTSFVMVVVNQSSSNINLNTSISNGTVTKLTKFTTSATKKMMNEGAINVSENSFVASVDAKSVTTFTSIATNGGKSNNLSPIAVAGNDMDIVDEEGDGSVSFTLDGTKSSDSDGNIQNYSWSLNGTQIAWTPKFDTKITSAGTFKYTLTVTDNDGATATDDVIVTMTSPLKTEIWLEAEDGIVGKTWQKLSDANASGGKYVMTNAGVQRLATPSNNPDSIVVLNFKTTETGIYKIWGRVICASANDDSFWVKVDDMNWINWNSIPKATAWAWDDVHDQSNDTPMGYELEPGDHKISICYREDGAQLDKILVANTGLVPTGLGNSKTYLKNIQDGLTNISIFPNPSTGVVNIECIDGFTSMSIYNQLGQLVYSENSNIQIQKKRFDLNLNSGTYLVTLRSGQKLGVAKLVIE